MTETSTAITSSDSWMRMSLALAFVIAVIFLCAWLLKKVYNGNFFRRQPSDEKIKILNRTSLGDKNFLVVAEIEGQYFLLGTSPQSVNLITELNQFSQNEEYRENMFERLLKAAGKRSQGTTR